MDSVDFSKKSVKEFLNQTLLHTLTYWKTHFKTEITQPELVLIGGEIKKEFIVSIAKFLASDKKVKVVPMWEIFPSQGAALRKFLGIYQQKEITLTSKGNLDFVRKTFREAFFSLWQKIIFIGSLIGIGAFFGIRFYLNNIYHQLEQNAFSLEQKHAQELKLSIELSKMAKKFNKDISLLISLKKQNYFPDKFLKSIFEVTSKSGIEILSLSGTKNQYKLKGEANSISTIADFKKTLEKDKRFKKVQLSFKNIQNFGNRYYFEINFQFQFKK